MPTVFQYTFPNTFGEDAAAYLAAYIGQPNHDTARLNAVLTTVAAQAKSYTRGEGWNDNEPAENIVSVIFSASARLLGNTSGLHSEAMGALSVTYGAQFGWTLTERFVLDRYRLRASKRTSVRFHIAVDRTGTRPPRFSGMRLPRGSGLPGNGTGAP